MMQLALFGLFLLAAVVLLVIAPILMHPTLPSRSKWALCGVALLVLVPGGIALYAWLGVPQMAALS